MATLSSRSGLTPVATTLSLTNNATTNVQNFDAYISQVIEGHVYIDATTDYRAAFTLTILKNGAGTYEISASDIHGDDDSGNPIVSFAMSDSTLQATLANYSGFSSASITYTLSAPKMDGQFPLTVNAENVQGKVNGTAVTAGYIGEYVYATCTSVTKNETSSDIDVTGMSITLSPGIWHIGYDVCARLFNETGTTTSVFGRVRITDSANMAVTRTEATIYDNKAVSTHSIGRSVSRSTVVNISTSTTYKVRIAGTATNKSMSILTNSITSTFTDPDNESVIWAIRIA